MPFKKLTASTVVAVLAILLLALAFALAYWLGRQDGYRSRHGEAVQEEQLWREACSRLQRILAGQRREDD